MRALATGFTTTFFCPLIPVFLGLGAILSLATAGFALDAADLTEGLALDFTFSAAALADPGLALGADAGFLSVAFAGAAGVVLAGAAFAAAGFAAAAFGAGAGVFDVVGLGAALLLAVVATLGAGAGVLAELGFFSAGLLEAKNEV